MKALSRMTQKQREILEAAKIPKLSDENDKDTSPRQIRLGKQFLAEDLQEAVGTFNRQTAEERQRYFLNTRIHELDGVVKNIDFDELSHD